MMRALLVALGFSLCLGAGHELAAQDTAQRGDKPLGEVRADQALVYLVREGAFVGGGRTIRVFIGDEVVGVLPNNSYTFALTPPGTHLMWASLTGKPLFVDLVGGRTYYVLLKIGEEYQLIDEEQGRMAVAKAKKYRALTEDDRRKGGKEGQEKWPKLQAQYADRLASVHDAHAAYVPPASTEGLLRVPSSTPITVELMEHVTSATSRASDSVWIKATRDVVVDGQVVVRKGTRVEASVRDTRAARSFGRTGLIDIAVSAVPTADGTRCPTIGQMVRQERHSGSADTAAVIGGLVGAVFVQGAEGYRPAGEQATVFTREDCWIRPVSDTPGTPAASQPDTPAIAGTVSAPLLCDFPKGRGPKDLQVSFDGTGAVAQVSLVEVLGAALPKPVPALAVHSSNGRITATFVGWQVCRFMRPATAGTALTFALESPDGPPLRGEATASLASSRSPK
jgi:hypothetical protein